MKLLRKLLGSSNEPCGYVAAMRKIALAPVIVPPRTPANDKE